MIRTVAVIGAGKLATRLSISLKEKGLEITGIWNRSAERGLRLAELIGETFHDELYSLPQSDLTVISVSDHAIGEISQRIKGREGIVCHTSGTMPLDILERTSARTGVFYPPQTFTHESPPDFEGIPLCIEGSDPETADMLATLAKMLSGKVVMVDSEQRLWLHLAATFASNFPNFLYSVAEKILKEKGLEMNLLVPLIIETSGHARHENIFSLQTGPAIRNDKPVIEKHLGILKEFPEYRDIYEIITTSIINHKLKNE